MKNLSPSKVEPKLRRAIKAAIDQGWTIVRGTTINALEHKCCALGALFAVGATGHQTPETIGNAIGIPCVRDSHEDAITAFVNGFDDSISPATKKHPRWANLGKRLAKEFVR